MTKTWFDGTSDETDDEIIVDDASKMAPSMLSKGVQNSISKGDCAPIIINSTPNANEGDMGSTIHLPTVTQSQDSEGDDGVDMTMPPIFNLETAGLCRSSHLEAAHKKNGLCFKSILTKILCIWNHIIYLP